MLLTYYQCKRMTFKVQTFTSLDETKSDAALRISKEGRRSTVTFPVKPDSTQRDVCIRRRIGKTELDVNQRRASFRPYFGMCLFCA